MQISTSVGVFQAMGSSLRLLPINYSIGPQRKRGIRGKFPRPKLHGWKGKTTVNHERGAPMGAVNNRLRPAVQARATQLPKLVRSPRVSEPNAFCSSGRRPYALRAPDTPPASRTSSLGVLQLSTLLTAHRTWPHWRGLEDKERSPSREASS